MGASPFPVANDAAMRRIVAGARPLQASTRLRAQEDVLKAYRKRILRYSSHYRVHPFADGAEGVVVERVHSRILESLFDRVPIPALPDRGRSAGNRVSPGGISVVQKQS